MSNTLKSTVLAAALMLLATSTQAGVTPSDQNKCGAAQLKAFSGLFSAIGKEAARACSTGNSPGAAGAVNGAVIQTAVQTAYTASDVAFNKYASCQFQGSNLTSTDVANDTPGFVAATAAIAVALCTP